MATQWGPGNNKPGRISIYFSFPVDKASFSVKVSCASRRADWYIQDRRLG